jgi:serine protease
MFKARPTSHALIRAGGTVLTRQVIQSATNAQAADGEPELRFVLELDPQADPAAVRQRIEQVLKRRVRFGPLFSGVLSEIPPESLASIYLLRVVGVDPNSMESSPFDIAEELARVPGVVRAEPDLETDFFPTPEEPFIDCWVNGPQPLDRAWALRNLRVPEAWAFASGRGEGVVIAQIDTGVTLHHELIDALDRPRAPISSTGTLIPQIRSITVRC